MLLIGSLNLLAENDNVNIPTGGFTKADSANVAVPVYIIKQANAKMVERLYLKQVNARQDFIINNQKEYINQQSIIIKDFQNRVNDCNQLNQSLRVKYEKKQKRNKYIITGLSAALGASILSLICSK